MVFNDFDIYIYVECLGLQWLEHVATSNSAPPANSSFHILTPCVYVYGDLCFAFTIKPHIRTPKTQQRRAPVLMSLCKMSTYLPRRCFDPFGNAGVKPQTYVALGIIAYIYKPGYYHINTQHSKGRVRIKWFRPRRSLLY